MTTPKLIIERMLTASGNTLLLALEPVSDDEFFAENPDGLSAAWVTGHLAAVADLFTSWQVRHKLFSPAFHAIFNDTSLAEAGPMSKAACVDPRCHPKALLLHRFREAGIKTLRALRRFDEDRWDNPTPPGIPVTFPTWGSLWEFLAVHVYWHSGALAAAMPRFRGTFTLNPAQHYFYDPEA